MIIDLSKKKSINLFPSTEDEAIEQNLRMIILTLKGSQPLDRAFGTDPSFIDKPINFAKNLFIRNVLDAIEMYETRVEILNFTFTDSVDGILKPKIEWRKK